jgi:hypothetical protein
VTDAAEHPLCERCGERHPEWQRCPFLPGNDLAVKHGAYATVALGPRVDELAEDIRDLVPGYTPCDEVAVRLLCLALARQERAEAKPIPRWRRACTATLLGGPTPRDGF